LCFLLWAKWLDAKDIHKEIFRVYGGKCLPCKVFHNWVEKRGKYFVDDEEIETGKRKWLRQQSKDFFDPLIMFWDKCINAGGEYVQKLMIFPG
jgi:hypothetical protein